MSNGLFPRARRYFARSPLSRDRKSTRLNSSHLVISYAVFCLKKKKHPRRDLLLALAIVRVHLHRCARAEATDARGYHFLRYSYYELVRSTMTDHDSPTPTRLA